MRPVRTPAAIVLPLVLAAAALSAVAAAPALASEGSHGGGGVRASGSCSGASTWKLSAKADDGRLEVEFEVDSNRSAQTWAWRLRDSGAPVATGTARTTAPSGSFTVERRIANTAGPDVIRFRATHAGEVCTGAVTV